LIELWKLPKRAEIAGIFFKPDAKQSLPVHILLKRGFQTNQKKGISYRVYEEL
jgi:hypothetical protein